MVHFGKELARRGREAADACADRAIHVIAHGQDVMVLQKHHVISDGRLRTLVILIRSGDRG